MFSRVKQLGRGISHSFVIIVLKKKTDRQRIKHRQRHTKTDRQSATEGHSGQPSVTVLLPRNIRVFSELIEIMMVEIIMMMVLTMIVIVILMMVNLKMRMVAIEIILQKPNRWSDVNTWNKPCSPEPPLWGLVSVFDYSFIINFDLLISYWLLTFRRQFFNLCQLLNQITMKPDKTTNHYLNCKRWI